MARGQHFLYPATTAGARLLQQEKVSFGHFDILTDEEVRQGLKTFSSWPTYPQLYASGKLLGGLDILKELQCAPCPLAPRVTLTALFAANQRHLCEGDPGVEGVS